MRARSSYISTIAHTGAPRSSHAGRVSQLPRRAVSLPSGLGTSGSNMKNCAKQHVPGDIGNVATHTILIGPDLRSEIEHKTTAALIAPLVPGRSGRTTDRWSQWSTATAVTLIRDHRQPTCALAKGTALEKV